MTYRPEQPFWVVLLAQWWSQWCPNRFDSEKIEPRYNGGHSQICHHTENLLITTLLSNHSQAIPGSTLTTRSHHHWPLIRQPPLNSTNPWLTTIDHELTTHWPPHWPLSVRWVGFSVKGASERWQSICRPTTHEIYWQPNRKFCLSLCFYHDVCN